MSFHQQQIRRSQDFDYFKENKKFVGGVLRNRIPHDCVSIIIRSEVTGKYLQFEKMQIFDKESIWFKSSKPELILEIKRDNLV
tara:strand:- start:2545 stop:2793 length:249 start_codon:yes stop_codon:yes gene_type:complete